MGEDEIFLWEPIVLCFELTDATLENFDKLLDKALLSQAFQNAVKDAFHKEAMLRCETLLQGKAWTGQNRVTTVGPPLLKAAQKSLIKEVKAQNEFLKLQGSLKSATTAFQKSPTGIWVDEHKRLLIIVGVAAVLGGAYFLYSTRSGDLLGDLTEDLLKKTVKVGTFELKTEVTSIKPSDREFGLKITGKQKWDRTKASLGVGALINDNKIDVSSFGSLSFDIGKRRNFKLSTTASLDYSRVRQPSLGDWQEKPLKWSFEASWDAKKKVDLSLRLKTSLDAQKRPYVVFSLIKRF